MGTEELIQSMLQSRDKENKQERKNKEADLPQKQEKKRRNRGTKQRLWMDGTSHGNFFL